MKFMITFNHVEGVWDGLSEAQRQEHAGWLERFVTELQTEKGASLVFVAPPAQRKTVRMDRNRQQQVTDGPAIAGREQLGGYYIIEAESMEEAVEWAKKGRWLEGSNEVLRLFGPSV